MRAWPYLQADSTLLDVALWLLMGGMPCVRAFESILWNAPTATLLELELCRLTEQEAARAVQRAATASATEDDPTYRARTFWAFRFCASIVLTRTDPPRKMVTPAPLHLASL